MKTAAFVFVCLLLLIRWLTATLPGYIHPDEFFQNPEITSRMIFKIDSFIPWEYQPEHASRSIVSPLLTTGLPFYLLKAYLPENQLPSTMMLFHTERLGSFFWSLGIDMCVYRLCKHMDMDPFEPMLLVATSLVTLAFHTRPFSNSFESVLLCLCLVIYADYVKKPTSMRALCLGGLFSLGVFTRITFPLYAFPIGVAFLVQTFKKNQGRLQSLFCLLLGTFLCAGACILIDSVYYGKLVFTVHDMPFRDVFHVVSSVSDLTALSNIRAYGEIVITPLNNILYNLNVDNLAQHGLHARYTHLLINLPLLFGPLAFFGLFCMPKVFSKLKTMNNDLVYVLVSMFFLGLIGLSIMPHQEARFLCPLLVPFVLIYAWDQSTFPLLFWMAWILFNTVTTFVFSFVHQGGMVPALGFIQRHTTGIHDCHVLHSGDLSCFVDLNQATDLNGFDLTTHLVFYKTYMPPRHLLALPLENKAHHVHIIDFGSDHHGLVSELTQRPGIPLRRHSKDKIDIDFAQTNQTHQFERTLLITPSFVTVPKIKDHRYLLIHRLSPHVSFDDIDTMAQGAQTYSPESQMSLNVYLLLSNQDDL